MLKVGNSGGNCFILFCTLRLKSLPPSFSCSEVRLYWTAPKCLSRNPIGILNECFLNKSRSSLKSWALSPPPVAIVPFCFLCLHVPPALSLLGNLERAGARRRMWCSQWLSREQWTNRSINLAGSHALLLSCLTWACQRTLLPLLFQPTWPLPHSGKQYSTTLKWITISSLCLGTANDTPWMQEPKKSRLLLSHGDNLLKKFWVTKGGGVMDPLALQASFFLFTLPSYFRCWQILIALSSYLILFPFLSLSSLPPLYPFSFSVCLSLPLVFKSIGFYHTLFLYSCVSTLFLHLLTFYWPFPCPQ